MNLVVSNIAWNPEEEAEVADYLQSAGVAGVELAPTKVWPAPTQVAIADALAYRKTWEDRGMKIYSFQALLFGQNHFNLFADETNRAEMLAYLSGVIQLAGQLGAGPLVFGSPRNRKRNETPAEQAMDTAADFFAQVARVAQAHNTLFCLEHNPADYGCDFVNTPEEALELVKRVNQPAFRLHLDLGGMVLAGTDYEKVLPAVAPAAAHFHISEPQLKPVGLNPAVPHEKVAKLLKESGYTGAYSIEMGRAETEPLEAIKRAVELAYRYYGQ